MCAMTFLLTPPFASAIKACGDTSKAVRSAAERRRLAGWLAGVSPALPGAAARRRRASRRDAGVPLFLFLLLHVRDDVLAHAAFRERDQGLR
jgi:hypothetical protein